MTGKGYADHVQITMEDLQIVEHVCREDPKVIEQCVISGIPKEDMHKVYCDRECRTSSATRRLCIDHMQHGQSASTNDLATKCASSKL